MREARELARQAHVLSAARAATPGAGEARGHEEAAERHVALSAQEQEMVGRRAAEEAR